MQRVVLAALIGLLFGTGIAVSGMANPAKVLNFFDVFGTWDPSLAFVMGGALVVTAIGYRFVLRRPKPVLEARFHVPQGRSIDVPLVAGATVFGIGAALVLDEFALIFYLRDVYWSEQGRTSVDAVFAAVAFTGLLLLGYHPLELLSPADFRADPDPWVRGTLAVLALANLALGVIVLLKGKIWTGLLGLFVLPILVLAAVRLSRPSAPWARWRYTTRPKKMERALRREKRWRRPIIRAKIYLQDAIAGKPSIVHAREATEDELARTVLPAPMASETASSREAPISSNA